MSRKHKLGLIAAIVLFASVSVFTLKGHPFGAAGADERLEDPASIRARAEAFASGYLKETLESVSIDQMELVDLRYQPAVTELTTSVTTGFYSTDPEDVWVLAWERGGVANVTTGQDDGTAVLVLVLRNGTGEVLSATAGIRQPEEQALARGPLPQFRQVFGPPPVAPDKE